MSIDKNVVTALQKSKYTLKAQSTQTINFLGAEPNYYRITNSGASPLYLGVSMMPTSDYFDMKIASATSKLFVDAYGHEQIYIYNPSMEEVNIIVTSFEAPFDPSVLAMTDMGDSIIEVEMNGNMVVSGFECSLPEGNHKIGNVEIEGTPTVKISNTNDMISEKVKKDINDIKTNASAIYSSLINRTNYEFLYDKTELLYEFKGFGTKNHTYTGAEVFTVVPEEAISNIKILQGANVLGDLSQFEELKGHFDIGEVITLENTEDSFVDIYNVGTANFKNDLMPIISEIQKEVQTLKNSLLTEERFDEILNSTNMYLSEIDYLTGSIFSAVDKKTAKLQSIVIDDTEQSITCESSYNTAYFGRIIAKESYLEKINITVNISKTGTVLKTYDGVVWNQFYDDFKVKKIEDITYNDGSITSILNTCIEVFE